MFGYLLFLLVLIPFIAFSAWASARVNATYSKYDRVQTRSCMTGYDTATRLMRSRGVSDIAVNRVEGKLTDHYNPSKKVVNLSMSTYGSASVAAVAVAAHEVGHVMQNIRATFPIKSAMCLSPSPTSAHALPCPSFWSVCFSTFSGQARPIPTANGQYISGSRSTGSPRSLCSSRSPSSSMPPAVRKRCSLTKASSRPKRSPPPAKSSLPQRSPMLHPCSFPCSISCGSHSCSLPS